MAQRTINQAFLAAAAGSEFNPSDWKPAGDPESLEDIWAVLHPGLYKQIDGDKAEVVIASFDNGDALRIRIPFKDGSSMDLKVSGKSSLDEGDFVKISTIKGQLLKKVGQKDIVRYDGELAE